jgi:hypothetical protein
MWQRRQQRAHGDRHDNHHLHGDRYNNLHLDRQRTHR